MIHDPLFEHLAVSARALLAGAPEGGLLAGEVVVDLFCGAGGWGEGARDVGVPVHFAVNHWPVAIETHRANNPSCFHHQGDAWRARPRSIIGDKRLGLLLASAACTTHSRARGSAPISKRVHMLGWCIARWMREAEPRVVEIENVPEWKDWGPTIKRPDGTRVQDPRRKGQTFQRWWRYCESLGYAMEMRVLDAPDFGAGSRRKRLFIKARRDGMPIVWPERTHGKGADVSANDLDQVRGRRGGSGRSRKDRGRAVRVDGGRGLAPFVTAADCIDWSDLGTSIFDRKRPLRPKTLARIAEGIRRFVLNDPAPFVLRVTQAHAPGGGWHVRSVNDSMATQTTRQDLAFCTPVVAPQNSGVFGQRVDETGPTITTKGHQALIAPIVTLAGGPKRQPYPADETYHTILNREDCGVATAFLATTGYGEREDQRPRVHRVSDLLGTSVDGVKQAVIAPVMMGAGGSAYAGKPTRMNGTMGTVKCDDRRAFAAPVLTVNTSGHPGASVRSPMPTATTGTHTMLVAALLMEYYGNSQNAKRPDQPLGAVTTLDRHGLVCVMIGGVEMVIVDILFRMLRPRELAKAMGFRDDYVWPKTQRDTVRLIGNAVSPPQARALVRSSLPRGGALSAN